MNALDLILLALIVMAAVGGWRLGLIARALGWVGALLGLAIAVSTVPSMVRWMGTPSDTAVFLVSAAAFILLATLGQTLGVAIGTRLRPAEQEGMIRRVDSAGGSLLGVMGVVVLVWLLVPLMATTNGWIASATRNSAIARSISDHLPDPPEQISTIEKSLVGGHLPELFAGLVPAPELDAPPAGSPVTAAMLDGAASSVARLQGKACGLIQSGSSFSVGEGLWVTNAHVVAGIESVELTAADGQTVGGGQVVAFDSDQDLALVRSDLRRPSLELGEAAVDQGGLVLGFPGGGQFEPSPFAVGRRQTATGYDIYDRNLVLRELVVLAAELEPGDSGSALLNGEGQVIGIAVATAPDRAGVAYGLNASAIADLLAANPEPASTGECLR